MPNENLTIKQIKLANIMGIADLDISPGRITEITGRNGSGKTSIIEAIKSIFKGGTDATLLRNGEKTGETVIVLDNELIISKTIKPSGAKLDIFKGREKFAKPQTVLDAMADILSINPVAFFTASKKERAKILLEILPLEFPIEKINTLLSKYEREKAPEPPEDRHAIEAIQAIISNEFDERTGINRALKEKESSINQLRETLVEVDFDADNLAASLTQREARKQAMIEKRKERVDNYTKERNDKLDNARQEYEKAIAEIENKYTAAKESVKQEYDDNISKMDKSFDSVYQPLIEEISTLQAQIKAAGGIIKTKELIKQYTDETANLAKQSEICTEIIQALEQIKMEMVQNLPIPGLEIKEGEIYRDGVPFDRLNTAQKVQISFDISKYKAKDLKVVCVDGLECLDSETYEAFKANAATSGLQLIVTRVTDTDLKIETSK